MTKNRQNSPPNRLWSPPTRSKPTPIDFRNNMGAFPHHPDLKPTLRHRNLGFSRGYFGRNRPKMGQKWPKMGQKWAKNESKRWNGDLGHTPTPPPTSEVRKVKNAGAEVRSRLQKSNFPSSLKGGVFLQDFSHLREIFWSKNDQKWPKMGQKWAKNGSKRWNGDLGHTPTPPQVRSKTPVRRYVADFKNPTFLRAL